MRISRFTEQKVIKALRLVEGGKSTSNTLVILRSILAMNLFLPAVRTRMLQLYTNAPKTVFLLQSNLLRTIQKIGQRMVTFNR